MRSDEEQANELYNLVFTSLDKALSRNKQIIRELGECKNLEFEVEIRLSVMSCRASTLNIETAHKALDYLRKLINDWKG